MAGILLITAGGRVLGFFREVLISSQYGTTPPADAFFTIQQLPTIVSTFVFGPFMIAYVPYYAAMRTSGIERKAVEDSSRAALRFGVAITAVMIGVGVVLLWLNIGPAGGQGLYGSFTVILALSIVPLIVTGLASVVLNARGQHVAAMAIAALTPAGLLACLILLTVLPIVSSADALPWSFVAGSVLSAVVGVIVLRRSLPAAPADAPTARPPDSATFRKELLASAAENVGFSLNQALTVFFAAGLGGGVVATYSYAYRITAFAFGLVSPLNIWIQTWMTRDESHREGRLLLLVITAMAALVVGIAIALIVVAGPLVAFVYLRGSFSEANAASVTAVLTPLAVYGVVFSLNHLFARYWFVQLQGAIYSRVMIAAYVIGNLLKAVMVGPFGLDGVIWASVIAEGAALAWFSVHVLRRARSAGPAGARPE